jgi:hypothetical protein
MGAPGAPLEPIGVVHVRRSLTRNLKCIECNTGPENRDALAASGVNDFG